MGLNLPGIGALDVISDTPSALERLILDFLASDLKEDQQRVIRMRITASFRPLTEGL
jgi:protein involved in polysaccharide export with SLBB domain